MADDNTQDSVDEFDIPIGGDGDDQDPDSQTPDSGTDADASADSNAPGADFPPELTEQLRRERMQPLPGETATAAYQRLTHHLSRKSDAFYRERRETERQAAAEIQQLRAGLEPMLRDYYQRQQIASMEEQSAQIPDRETDPQGYAIWLQEEVLRRDEERRQEDWRRSEQARLQQADAEVQGQVAMIDQAGYAKVAEGLGQIPGSRPDADFTAAYETYSESALEAARAYFPDASEDQIYEFIGLSQQLDIRRAELNGVDIRDVMKGRMNKMIDGLVRRGLVTRAQGKEMASGDNGQPKPPNRVAMPGNGNGNRTVAERVAADAGAAARRGPSAVPSSTRPSSLPGQLPDASGMDEDDFVEAALSGLLGTEEQRVSKHRQQR